MSFSIFSNIATPFSKIVRQGAFAESLLGMPIDNKLAEASSGNSLTISEFW